MEIYYDPLDAACKTITGAVPRGEELQLNLFSVPAQGPEPQNPQDSAAAEAFFVLKKDGETERRFPLTKDETGWHIRMRIRICQPVSSFVNGNLRSVSPSFLRTKKASAAALSCGFCGSGPCAGTENKFSCNSSPLGTAPVIVLQAASRGS